MADLPDELRAALATSLAGRTRRADARGGRAPDRCVPVRGRAGVGPDPRRLGRDRRVRRVPDAGHVRGRPGGASARCRRYCRRRRASLDVGGGTGAAAWAVADAFPSIERITVLDQVDGALDARGDAGRRPLPRRLCGRRRGGGPRFRPSCRRRTWSPSRTCSGELAEAAQRDLVVACGGRRRRGRDRRARYAGRLRPGDRRPGSIARTRPSGARARARTSSRARCRPATGVTSGHG